MILHLTLQKKWFDLILCGLKPDEYREIKPYWLTRLFDINPTTSWEFENIEDTVACVLAGYVLKCPFKKITHIKFTNGYSPTSPTFTIECKGIRIGRGNPEWGAPADRDVFIISLGNIINS